MYRRNMAGLLKRVQQSYASTRGFAEPLRPLPSPLLLERPARAVMGTPSLTFVARPYSSGNSPGDASNKATSASQTQSPGTKANDPSASSEWVKELLKILGPMLVGASGTWLAYKSGIFSSLNKAHSKEITQVKEKIEANLAAGDELLAKLPINDIQPLLQLYSTKKDENEINLLKKAIQQIDLLLLQNERFFKQIMEIEQLVAPPGFLQSEPAGHSLQVLSNLKTKLTVYSEQLNAVRGFCETFLFRMEKRFPEALIAANIWVQKATHYQEILEASKEKSLSSAQTLLANAYNHRAKIHRSLAGVDLDNLNLAELALSRQDYEAGLKVKFDKNIVSSLAFLLNDTSAMLPLPERKIMLTQALNYHQQALAMDNHDPNIQHGFAWDLYKLQLCQLESGEPLDKSKLQEALDAFSITEKLNRNARLYHDRALTYLLMGNEQAALGDFASGLQLDFNHPLVCYEYGKLLLKRGEATLALESLTRGRTVSVDNLSLKKKYDRAIQEALAAAKQNPPKENSSPVIFSSPAITLPVSKDQLEELDIIKIAKQKEFEKAMRRCAEYAQQSLPVTQPPKIFVSYAWGNPKHERWVEQFSKELELAGFTVLLDRWYDRKGKELMDFVSKISEPDVRVLTVGTPAYLEKFNRKAIDSQHREPVVGIEMRLISYVIGYSREHSEQIIPVLLEGTPEASFPFILRPKLFADFTGEDKFTDMFALVRDIYGIPNRDGSFEAIKQDFQRVSQAIERTTPPEVVKTYRAEQQQVLAQWQQDIDKKAQTSVQEVLNSRPSPLK